MLLSLGIGVPIAFYLWQTGAVKKQSPNPATQPRGAAQEYIQNAEGSENGERESKALAPYIDEVRDVRCIDFLPNHV